MDLLKGLGDFCSVLAGSCFIGCSCGLLNSLITKFTSLKKEPVIETTVFILISYSSFLLSEAFHMAGIVAVLICGLVQRHYTHNNLSPVSRKQTSEVTPLSGDPMSKFLRAQNFSKLMRGGGDNNYKETKLNEILLAKA